MCLGRLVSLKHINGRAVGWTTDQVGGLPTEAIESMTPYSTGVMAPS